MRDTKIQWCDSTVNPTMGCDGCELWTENDHTCYAGVLHTRYGGVTKGFAPSFEQVTLFPGRMKKAADWPNLVGTLRNDKEWLHNARRLIFVSDMSDALSNSVPFEFLKEEIIDIVKSKQGSRHIWLWLTKRPERLYQFYQWVKDWPLNLWVGTSVTSQNTTSRIESLIKIQDKNIIKFISVEPQRTFIDINDYLPHLQWIIQGGESGPNAHPFHISWAHDMRIICKEYGVPYFLKQLGSCVVDKGKTIKFKDSHAGDWTEWNTLLKTRDVPIAAWRL